MKFKLLINKYKSIGFVTFSLLLGAIITFIALPFLTRLYSVHDFGQYGVALAIVSVLSTVANLRLDQAQLVASNSDQKKLIFEAFIFSLILCLIIGFLLNFFLTLRMVLAICFGVFLNSLFQSFYNYNFSCEMEKFCAILNILRSFIVVIVQLTLPLFLSVNLIESYTVSSILMIILILVYILYNKIYTVSFNTYKNYKDFIYSNTPHALLNSFSHNLPYYAVSSFLGYNITGYYSIVERTLRLPINLMSQTIRQFYIRQFHTKNDVNEALKSTILLSIVSFPFFCIFFILPEKFYIFIFGNEWLGISKYFKILTLGYWAIFFNPPISGYLIANRKSSILLKLQFYELLIKISLFFIGFILFENKDYILYIIPLSLIFYNLSILLAVIRMKKC